jgi:hypothetical protein
MTIQHKRAATLAGVFAASVFFIWAGSEGWKIESVPAQYVGYVTLFLGVAGLLGFNIFRGGPFDPERDPAPGEQKAVFRPSRLNLLAAPVLVTLGLALFFWETGGMDFRKLTDPYLVLEHLKGVVFAAIGIFFSFFYWPGLWKHELVFDEHSLTYHDQSPFPLTIPYRDIQSFRHRGLYLVIFGFQGKPLLKFINNFQNPMAVEAILRDVIRRNPVIIPDEGLIFGRVRPLKSFLLYLFSILAVSLGITYGCSANLLLAGMVGGMVLVLLAFLFWNVQRNVQRIEAREGTIFFFYLLRKKSFKLSEISNLYVSEIYQSHARIPVLVFELEGGGTIRVQKLGEEVPSMFARIEPVWLKSRENPDLKDNLK